jgi:hypothetical protein
MSEAALFPNKLPLIFDFFSFLNPFYGGSGTGSGTVMRPGSGSAEAKRYGSCGSVSTTLVRGPPTTRQKLQVLSNINKRPKEWRTQNAEIIKYIYICHPRKKTK